MSIIGRIKDFLTNDQYGNPYGTVYGSEVVRVRGRIERHDYVQRPGGEKEYLSREEQQDFSGRHAATVRGRRGGCR